MGAVHQLEKKNIWTEAEQCSGILINLPIVMPLPGSTLECYAGFTEYAWQKTQSSQI